MKMILKEMRLFNRGSDKKGVFNFDCFWCGCLRFVVKRIFSLDLFVNFVVKMIFLRR